MILKIGYKDVQQYEISLIHCVIIKLCNNIQPVKMM